MEKLQQDLGAKEPENGHQRPNRKFCGLGLALAFASDAPVLDLDQVFLLLPDFLVGALLLLAQIDFSPVLRLLDFDSALNELPARFVGCFLQPSTFDDMIIKFDDRRCRRDRRRA